jgi:radical SAM protein with 4Fe4S-binding SPASM domain
MDKFRIDSHKLMFHLPRVDAWLKKKTVYPIYMEVSLSGACNHRCTYCALDFMKYQPRFLETKLLKSRLLEVAQAGVKSIMYAGEGEPLLHKNAAEIINHTKKSGIDVALTTNGVLYNKELADATLKNITWIKVSINGSTKKTYANIHRSGPEDLDTVLKNLSYAVRLRKQKGYSCVLGMQLLLLPENAGEVLELAKIARKIGIDYLVVKPYSQHLFSKTTRYRNIKYNRYLSLSEKLAAVNTDKFNVIFRINTMQKWDKASRDYSHCYALPFWAYIDSLGNIWSCSAYLTDNRFKLGNIYEDTFRKIWNSQKAKKLMRWAKDTLDTGHCRVNCRMDEINRYLWELKHPSGHVNFI